MMFAKALGEAPAGQITAGVFQPVLSRIGELAGKIGIKMPEYENNTAAVDVINKVRGSLADVRQKEGGSQAYQALESILGTIPSNFNSKEGQAALVPSLLLNDQIIKDKNRVYQNHRDYVREQHNLSDPQTRFTGRGLDQAFTNATSKQYADEKKILGSMYLDPINLKSGDPAMVSKDAQGRPKPTTVMNYLIENAGQNLDPKIYKAITNKYGADQVNNIIRIFRGG
jgi:hypothetical protein